MSGLLVAEGLTKAFHSVVAVDDVSIAFEAGATTALIGPNGAGKTTLFNLLTGVLAPTSGEIRLDGDRIDGRSPHEIARRGVARSYQVTNFFPDLTARENVRLAAQEGHTGFSPGDLLRHHDSLEASFEAADAVLERLGLADVADRAAHSLSHGQQRHLEIGIAFANEPELLLLDEPTAGMSPDETGSTVELIKEIAEDVTIVVVEHDMDVVMDVSDEVAVMYRGSILAKETPADIRENERVQEVYLRGGG